MATLVVVVVVVEVVAVIYRNISINNNENDDKSADNLCYCSQCIVSGKDWHPVLNRRSNFRPRCVSL